MKRLLFLVFLIILLFEEGMVTAAELRLVVLDVGMGQSVLLVKDGHGLLIDTGYEHHGPHVLAQMNAHGVRNLDYLLLSHLHPDHAGGYFSIREAWPHTPVLESCHRVEEVQSSEREAILKVGKALDQDPLRECLSGGDRLKWLGYELQVLWPRTVQGTDLNRNSLVLLLTGSKGENMLFMGDVDKSVEKVLAAALPPSLRTKKVDLYVAAHHAAADSTDPHFLSLIRPHFSVVSVGENPYGYPADESISVLERYSRILLRTDRDGELCFVLNEKGCTLCERDAN